ncbi:hypothetical protein CUJ89_07960 [Burkholderia pyrrocinia]|uniref:Uncharacterized protein n=1 Tax=Burkholderia pyrrocinia TaxID=60550 RepID=A0A2Z5MZW2_BURPY|nr:hypothetical protein [Burkholderia pyrrocinia]AXF22238.1 hypothetical protein CUJ89_07960 [Burkholderia pyrrocinia]
MSKNTTDTALHRNPFYVLGVTTRDDRRKIVAMAEERSLHLDSDVCQIARSTLTNPRMRLSAEMAWMPGVAPRIVESLMQSLSDNPQAIRSEQGLPSLARANLMATACELFADDESVLPLARFIRDFAAVVETIDLEEVLRDVNEDRSISGFPEVQTAELVEEELSERRKTYRLALRNLLDTMEPTKLIETLSTAVNLATAKGNSHGPTLLDDLVDSYEVEAQGLLQKEAETLLIVIENARQAAPRGAHAVDAALDRLEKIARNWYRFTKPIQTSAKSRGIVHQPSQDLAYALRGVGVMLNNEHSMLDQADRITRLLRELFAELPEVAERAQEDSEVIRRLRLQAEERDRDNEQWARDITFCAEVGLIFKDELAISPQGIRYNGRSIPLNSITRVRWGGVRRSVNGIPTGTDYTIAIGNNDSEQVIKLRKETTYSGFVAALWRAVCVRLVLEMIAALEKGQSFAFGDFVVEDDAVTLFRHKFFGSSERVRLNWHEVRVWSADGRFYIGTPTRKEVYGSASYIHICNTHIIEHIIRGGFEKGIHKLSDYVKG